MTEASESGTQSRLPTVTVVGGGVAGLAAACALAGAGYAVRLLERRPYLGGRASSYEHPGTGEVIDNCQHVLLGCCASLVRLYERLGAADAIRWYEQIAFLEPGGRRSLLAPSFLPAPLHSAPAFLRAPMLRFADKLAIARGLRAVLSGIPEDTEEDFAGWLARHRQTPRAIERFWKPVLVSALNEEMPRISTRYAAQVVREAFLRSPEGGRMGVPAIPLSDLYGRATQYLQARGGEVHLRAAAEAFSFSPQTRQWTVETPAGAFTSDAVVLALPFEGMARLLPALPENAAARLLGERLARFEHSPITGIHLWFDREIAPLDHAVLLDATIQWMFNKSRLQPGARAAGQGSYLELVVSASRGLVEMSRQQVVDLALRELAWFFPAVHEAKLLKAAVVKEVRATYSIVPGLDSQRPGALSPWPGIFLAGDWTATGWPSTMEGAARSGFLAAEALARAAGRPEQFAASPLPASGLMRLAGF